MSTRGEIAVFGGTGKTGRAVLEALRARGVPARPLGRAGYTDPAAAAGCEAAYLIAPNLYADEPGLVRDVLAGLAAHGVERVVYHSVAAPYEPSMPHHLGKAEAERLVRASGMTWTILQPCAYLQNLVALVDLAADSPEIAVPYAGDRLFGMVDLADVADCAATVLTEPGHAGATYELGGPELVSVSGVAEIASELVDRPVAARRIAPPPEAHPWLVAMFDYYDRHGLPSGPVPLRAVLGREPNDARVVLAREIVGHGS